MRALRAVSVLVIGAIVALTLSACDTFLPDPVAFTSVQSQPLIRFCLPLTISKITISTYANPAADNATVVWAADGSAFVKAGTDLALGVAPAGFTVTQDDGVEFLSEPFNVQVAVSSRTGGSWDTFSYFSPNSIEDGVWLDGRGIETEAPCTRGDCMPMSACYNAWPIPTGAPTLPETTFVPEPSPVPTP